VQIKERGEASLFLRVAPGVFALRSWLEDGTVDPEAVFESSRPMVPFYPTYSEVRALLPVWNRAPEKAITGMQSEIAGLMGTPQEQVSWKDPDQWIPERLGGDSRQWAERTWQETKYQVNPRYITGHWLLIRNFRLMSSDAEGNLTLGERGGNFLARPEGETVREIDQDQGLLWILRLVAEAGSPSHGDLKAGWMEFLVEESNVRSEYSASVHLSHRLRNLTERQLVERSGRSYQITEAGLRYLEQAVEGAPADDPAAEIRRLQERMRQEVREGLREALQQMDPYAFEGLIQRLMDAMGYQNTEVTSPSSDGGVDVLGTIKVGISEIREVVQAKRQKRTIGRGVLDQLRGSLYRFDAVQGTVITTGTFSRGARDAAFDRGAAPITLIDGDTLVQLLIDHDLGVQKRKIELWEMDLTGLLGGGEGA